jgi:hypothetical protein
MPKKIAMNKFAGFLLTLSINISFVSISFSQTLPLSTSCTSKDLELKKVRLAYTGLCFPYGQPTNVILEIYNKTGSVRTSFGCWGKLVRTINGVAQQPISVFICGGPIQPSSTNSIVTSFQITVNEGESIELKDLFLAWTTSNNNQTCDYLKNNSAIINPKCGTLPSIAVEAGVAGKIFQTAAVCGDSGPKINATISPYGGTAPYKVSIDGGSDIDVAANGSHTFSNLNAGVTHVIKVKDKNNCSNNVSTTISSITPVVANAGNDFTKNCLVNTEGKTIGESTNTGFTYSWSPSTGLSSSTISNPLANPDGTTSYIVTKTDVKSGCLATDTINVTVDNAPVTADAGSPFTKTCVANLDGKTIGESSAAAFTYTWSPVDGLSSSTASSPTANPTQTTTYTLTKTHSTSGCYGTSQVTVTVSDTKPSFGVTQVQPTVSLCSAATLGSVTFCASGGSGLEYSITGGDEYSSNPIFTALGSGAVKGYRVRNSDGCVTSASCATVTNCSTSSAAPVTSVVEGSVLVATPRSSLAEKKPTVKVYPNPFQGQVNFNIQSPIAGKTLLEVFDAMGRKIGVVFQGHINAGEIRNFSYNIPENYNGTLIYRLSVGEQTTNGKLISNAKRNQYWP